ncbi:MAG: Methionine import system permease protein MetP [Firmicutes bacterium ADurb.Bin506]|jgi:D-methionine transport system permease protein|nr:MAG: Methionine import system permease protein MetP [Firmicutes bacterium ADurb.Bin506]
MLIRLIWSALLETLLMVGAAGAVSIILGVLVGAGLVFFSDPALGRNWPVNRYLRLDQVLSAIVNAGRSLPFLVLMVAIIPFTRMIAGTSIGTKAAIVPLTLGAIPFAARVVENSLREVDRGVVEAALVMGASPGQVVFKVMFPEALPSLVLGFTLTLVSLVNFSAMAGAVGGGGLGDLAIRYGYQRFRTDVMAATVAVLIVLVQLMQWGGQALSSTVDRRR